MRSDSEPPIRRDPIAALAGPRDGVYIVRMRVSTGAVCMLAFMAAPGCVTQAQHDVIQRQLAETHDKLGKSQAAEEGLRATLTRKVDEARANDQKLRAEIAALNQQLADGEARQQEQEQRLATMMSDKGAMEASIAEMQEALAELRRRRAASERRVAAYRDLLVRFQTLIDSGALQVKVVDGRMVVQMQTDILFASGSATLSAAGKRAVADVAAVLAEIPERRYQVEGHTDDVPIRTTRYPSNWELASARALNVVQAMIGAGLSPSRVSAASFSEYRPAVPNDSAGSKAQNRRIEIVVVPNLDDLPGAEDLRRVRR